MPRGYPAITGQLAFPESAEPAPAIKRALRAGPRLRRIRSAPARNRGEAAVSGRMRMEWHELSPGERITAWAGLRAWVTWLTDRYELSIEERLPRCWARHPGLIEELHALRAWREEIYQAQQFSGQAARYWHSELRQVLHAASTVYAAGCRTGHRSTPPPAAADGELQRRWAEASPVAGIPPAELAARHHAGEGLTHLEMSAALDSGRARQPGPGMPGLLLYAGTWWVAVSGGWFAVSDPGQLARMNFTGSPGPDTSDKGS